MDLSIIIVNYQTYQITKNTIDSILKFDHSFSYEIILVDSASSDDSFSKLKDDFKGKIKFIASKVNNGFAYSNNLAIKKSKGSYILLLNSDTLVEKNTLSSIYDYMQKNKDVGVCGCQVLLEDGNLDKACKRSFPNPQNAFYRLFNIPTNSSQDNYNLDDLDDNGIYEIDCLTGAFMFIRHQVFDSVDLLDENFFMYGEDIDLCYRIKKAGWKIVYFGKVKITHFKGSSSKKQKNKLIYEFYRAMYLYYSKHLKNNNPFYLNFLVYIGIFCLYISKIILNVFKSQ